MSIETRPRRRAFIPISILLLLLSGLLYWFGETWSRHTLQYLSRAGWARGAIQRFAVARQVSRRFVAGETIEEAIQIARDLNRQGMRVTVDFLGESVSGKDEALAARSEIMSLYDRIAAENLDANVSVKMTQLGLALDPGFAFDNVLAIARKAEEHGNFLRIDMEDSPTVDITFEIKRRLGRDYGLHNVGVVIQSYLYRSQEDVERLIEEGVGIRLCKGAYLEPDTVAFPAKADVDRNYVKLMQLLLSDEARAKEVYVGLATHDENMIGATIDFANKQGIGKDEFEFQMLYGIRRDLQERLVADGYRVRVYVPYGTAWYPYFVRRLAERPANLWFFLNNLVRS